MKKFLLKLLVAANLVLLAVLAQSPAQAASVDGWSRCCKQTVEGPKFCCANCCWFTYDCDGPLDCNVIVE